MVNIVLVSHVSKLAEGLKALLDEMVKDKVKITAVGGKDGRTGSDADDIIKAIEDAASEDGVVLIADIGSSVVNGIKAVETCGRRQKVKIADCPFVEGAVAAAVEASIGAKIEEVLRAAEETVGYKKIMSN